jgi:hypothetical protein
MIYPGKSADYTLCIQHGCERLSHTCRLLQTFYK